MGSIEVLRVRDDGSLVSRQPMPPLPTLDRNVAKMSSDVFPPSGCRDFAVKKNQPRYQRDSNENGVSLTWQSRIDYEVKAL